MGIIRAHTIDSTGTTGVPGTPRGTATDNEVHAADSFILSQTNPLQFWLYDPALPRGIATTQTIITVTLRISGLVDSVFTPTTFGAANGAGSGTGPILGSATNITVARFPDTGTGDLGLLITYGTAAQRSSADTILGSSTITATVLYETSAAVAEIPAGASATTFLPDDQGGFVQAVYVNGQPASNAEERRLIATIDNGTTSEITYPIRPGVALPGGTSAQGGAAINHNSGEEYVIFINS